MTKCKFINKHHAIQGITEEYSWNEPEKTKCGEYSIAIKRVCELGTSFTTLDKQM